MSLLQRILTPLCGHTVEIEKLQKALTNANVRADIATRLVHQAKEEFSELVDVIREGHPTDTPYEGAVASVRIQRRRAYQEIKFLTESRTELSLLVEELTTQNSMSDAALVAAATDLAELTATKLELENTIAIYKTGGVQRPLLAIPPQPDNEEPPAEDQLVADTHGEEVWGVGAVIFAGRHDRQWTLTRDDETISVPIADHEWLDGAVRGGSLAFRAGDVLRVRMHTVSLISARTGKPYTRRRVEKVLEHLPPQEQQGLLAAGGAS